MAEGTARAGRRPQPRARVQLDQDTYGIPFGLQGHNSGFGGFGSSYGGYHLRPNHSTRTLHEEEHSSVEQTRPDFLGEAPVPKVREESARQRYRDWRIWPLCVKEAAEYDKDLTKEWDDNMDVLLIFAGLFSAVVTSFLIQVSQNLQPNYQMYIAYIAMANFNHSNYDPLFNPSQFTIQQSDRVVNGLWFAALTFSLSAALLAMLCKTWIREYSSGLATVAYDKARQRQFRWNGLKQWRMGELINSLPMLLHISVFLFFVGLISFLNPLDYYVFTGITVLCSFTIAVYAILTGLPLFFADCPFKTPLSKFVRRWFLSRVRHTGDTSSLRAQELEAIDKKSGIVEAHALAWLIEESEKREVADAAEAAVETIPSLRHSKTERDALFKRGVLSALYRLLLNADQKDEQRVASILRAIEVLWQPDSTGGSALRRKETPKDDLHTGFFTRLVEILESSSSELILDAAIQLPKQFSDWPIAVWPIASRVRIPALMKQISEGRFSKPASLSAALGVVHRVLSLMFRTDGRTRHVTEEDLFTCIPSISSILLTTTSADVRGSVIELVETIDDILYRVPPPGWMMKHINIFTNDEKGLIPALVLLLSDTISTGPHDRKRVRQVLCNLFAHREIGDLCVDWVIQHGGIRGVVYDFSIFSVDPVAPDESVLRLLDYVTRNGSFAAYLAQFLEAGVLNALAHYFQQTKPICDSAVLAGLLRRLLRLTNTSEGRSLLHSSGVLETAASKFLRINPQSNSPEEQQLAKQMEWTRRYLGDGTEPPSVIFENQLAINSADAPPPFGAHEAAGFGAEKGSDVDDA